MLYVVSCKKRSSIGERTNVGWRLVYVRYVYMREVVSCKQKTLVENKKNEHLTLIIVQSFHILFIYIYYVPE